ncbi:hypothetical protein ACJJTC_003518 [Scirpophaga incertulas]
MLTLHFSLIALNVVSVCTLPNNGLHSYAVENFASASSKQDESKNSLKMKVASGTQEPSKQDVSIMDAHENIQFQTKLNNILNIMELDKRNNDAIFKVMDTFANNDSNATKQINEGFNHNKVIRLYKFTTHKYGDSLLSARIEKLDLSPRKYLNPIKDLHKNAQDIWLQLNKKKITNVDYRDISALPVYDYPEIWWTMHPPTTDTNQLSKALSNKTLKATVLKKSTKAINIKRTHIKRKKTTKLKPSVKTTKSIKTKMTTANTENNAMQYFIIHKDNKGDMSVEAKGGNLIVEGRKNKTNPGLHTSVLGALSIQNDIELSDYEYAIYDNYDGSYDDKLLANNVSHNIKRSKHVTPVIIKILKRDAVNETMKLLNAGAPLLIGPKNSIVLPGRQSATSYNGDSGTNHFFKYTAISNTFANVDINKQFNRQAKVNNIGIDKRDLSKIADFEEIFKTMNPQTQDFVHGDPSLARDVATAEYATTNVIITNDYHTEEIDKTLLIRELPGTTTTPGTVTNTVNVIDDPDAFLPQISTTDYVESMKMEEEETKIVIIPTAAFTLVSPRPEAEVTTHEIPKARPEQIPGFVVNLIRNMKRLSTGCFSVAAIELFDMMAAKKQEDADVIFKSYLVEVDTMLRIDRMFYIGSSWMNALDNLAEYLAGTPVDILQQQSKLLHSIMLVRNATLSKDINSVIDYIDTVYIDDECLTMFKVLAKFNEYPNVTETAAQLHRQLTDAVYHPMIRLRGTPKLRILIDGVNVLIDNHKSAPIDRRHVKRTKIKQTSLLKALDLVNNYSSNNGASFRPIIKTDAKRNNYYTSLSDEVFNKNPKDIKDLNNNMIQKNTHKTIGKRTELNRSPFIAVDEKTFLYKHDLINYKGKGTPLIVVYEDRVGFTTQRRTKRLKKYNRKIKIRTSPNRTESLIKKKEEVSKKHNDRYTNRKRDRNMKMAENFKQPKSYKHEKRKDTNPFRESKRNLTKYDEIMMKYVDLENKYRNLVKLYKKKFFPENI